MTVAVEAVPAPPSVAVLGVPVCAASLRGAAEAVVERALSGAGGYAVQANVHVVVTAAKDERVAAAVAGAWAAFADGAPVAWVQRRLGARGAERVGGPDLLPLVLDRGRARGLRHAFVGSTEPVLAHLVTRLRERFPGVEIAGSVAPPFGDPSEWSDGVVATVRNLEPHVVWLALGAPRQELWMRAHAAELAPALVLGVGAAFDFHAGTKPRAPQWMQRAGLEWLHRLASEPRRLAGRYATTNTEFAVRAARQVARRGRA